MSPTKLPHRTGCKVKFKKSSSDEEDGWKAIVAQGKIKSLCEITEI
jgi:hypothetical protein